MALIDSLLRKKRLALSRETVRLHDAWQRLERAASALSMARHAHRDAQEYLWEQLSSDGLLCIQRLNVARTEERRWDSQARESLAAHQVCLDEHAALKEVVARAQREIEKLEEMRAARLGAQAHEHQKIEWQHLDEWVTTRHERTSGREQPHE